MFDQGGGGLQRREVNRHLTSSLHRVCLSFTSFLRYFHVCVVPVRIKCVLLKILNPGMRSHATQFLFKISVLKLLYGVKNKTKIALDAQGNSGNLSNLRRSEEKWQKELPISSRPSTNGSREGQWGSHAPFVWREHPELCPASRDSTCLAWIQKVPVVHQTSRLSPLPAPPSSKCRSWV